MSEVTLTKLEIELLKGFMDSDFHESCDPIENLEGNAWVVDGVEKSGISEKSARGVLASLVKKDVIAIQVAERPDENSCMNLINTELVKKVLNL